MRQGHSLALYCYAPPRGVPHGVEIRDAAEILPAERVISHRATGSVSLFSNLFRYELQRWGLGTWVDCDIYLLKPLDSDRPYLFGEEEPGCVNTGILRLPADSPVLKPLIELFDERTVPPWLPARARLASRLRLGLSGRSGLAMMPWGSAGPKAFTWALRKYGLSAQALSPAVFNPLPWVHAHRIAEEPLGHIALPASVAVHLWNQRIRHLKKRPAAIGSFLHQLQQEGKLTRGNRASPPPLSVVMPVRNARPWLDEAIESILAQTFEDFEFVILDDASTDGSRQRLRQWAALDDRIRLFESDEWLGPVGSSNRVVAESRAPLVARMDADDTAAPHRLARQMEAFARRPDAVIIGALSDVIDGRGNHLRGADYPRLTRPSTFAPFSHPTIVMRRDAFNKVGGYREAAALWEDVDLYKRLSVEGPVLIVPEPLVSVRYAGRNNRLASGEDTLIQAMDAMYNEVSPDPRAQHRLRPSSVLSAASVRLWAGEAPGLFRRLASDRRLGWNKESAFALAWAAWADLSPRTLRFALRTRLALRTPAARRRLRGAEILEWRSGDTPRPG